MNSIGRFVLGAAGLAAGCALAATQRALQQEVAALSRRVDEVASRAEPPALSAALDAQAQRLSSLEEESQRHGQAIQNIQTAVDRIERGFALLGDRLATQTEVLESLQASYSDKEQKLQMTLRAVIDAVNEIRRAHVAV